MTMRARAWVVVVGGTWLTSGLQLGSAEAAAPEATGTSTAAATPATDDHAFHAALVAAHKKAVEVCSADSARARPTRRYLTIRRRLRQGGLVRAPHKKFPDIPKDCLDKTFKAMRWLV